MNYLKFPNNFAADCIVECCEIISRGGIERSYLGRFAGPGKNASGCWIAWQTNYNITKIIVYFVDSAAFTVQRKVLDAHLFGFTVDSKIILALEIVRVKELVLNAVFEKNIYHV